MPSSIEINKAIVLMMEEFTHPRKSDLLSFLTMIANGTQYTGSNLVAQITDFENGFKYRNRHNMQDNLSFLDIVLRVAVRFDQVATVKTLVENCGADPYKLHWTDEFTTPVSRIVDCDDSSSFGDGMGCGSSNGPTRHWQQTVQVDTHLQRSLLEYCFNPKLGIKEDAMRVAEYLLTLDPPIDAASNLKTLTQNSTNYTLYEMVVSVIPANILEERMPSTAPRSFMYKYDDAEKIRIQPKITMLILQSIKLGYFEANTSSNWGEMIAYLAIRNQCKPVLEMLCPLLQTKAKPRFYECYKAALNLVRDNELWYFNALIKGNFNPNIPSSINVAVSPLYLAIEAGFNLQAIQLIKLGADFSYPQIQQLATQKKATIVLNAMKQPASSTPSSSPSRAASLKLSLFPPKTSATPAATSSAVIPPASQASNNSQLVITDNSVMILPANAEGREIQFSSTALEGVLGKDWLKNVDSGSLSLVLHMIAAQLEQTKEATKADENSMSLF